jgi:hypothetical protein
MGGFRSSFWRALSDVAVQPDRRRIPDRRAQSTRRLLRASLTRHFWWTAAQLGLCLGGIGDQELQRLLLTRLRSMMLSAGGAAFLIVLAGGLSAVPAELARNSGGNASRTLAIVAYSAAAVLALIAVVIWQYSRTMVRRALRDRNQYPIPCKGTVRRLIASREGGWPLLLRSEQGRWLWLTGSSQTLASMRLRLTGRMPRRSYRLSVTLTYYPRSRVVHEIAGMAVEDLGEAIRGIAPSSVPWPGT